MAESQVAVVALTQTFPGALLQWRCFQLLPRLCADSVKKLYFSAIRAYIFVSCRSSLVTLQQTECTVSQQRTSEVAGGVAVASPLLQCDQCDPRLTIM